MPKKYISIAVALVVTVGAAVCEAELAFAQDATQSTLQNGSGSVAPYPTTSQPVPYYEGGRDTMSPPPMPTNTGNYPPKPYPTLPSGGPGAMPGQTPPFMPPNGRMMPPPQGDGYGQAGEYRTENQNKVPVSQYGGPSERQFGAQQTSGDNGGNGEGDRNSDERGKQIQKQQLDQMKRGMKGMEQGVIQTKKMIDRLVKKGIAVPAEYSAVVTELQGAFATVKAAKEQSDEVDVALETIQDKSDTLREIGPKLGMLEQWPKMLSQAEKQIKRLNDAVAKAKKKKGADQYAAVIAKVESAVSAVGVKYAEVKQLGDSGDIESAMDAMQDFPEQMQEAQRELSVLDKMSNLAKMISSADKEITNFEKQSMRFSKKGADVSKVTAIIVEARAKITELKALGISSSAEPEDFFNLMRDLDEYRKDMTDAINALSGRPGSLEGAVIYAFRRLQEGR